MRTVLRTVVLILAVLGVAWAGPIDLTGTWTLDKDASDAPGELLKAQGASYVERKVAAEIDMTLVITQAGDEVTIETQSRMQASPQTLIVDGVARQVTNDKGEVSNVVHSWQNNTLVTRSDAVATDGQAIQITRSLLDEGRTLNQQILMTTAEGEAITVVRVFRKR